MNVKPNIILFINFITFDFVANLYLWPTAKF